ncbi:hypothetical protein LZC95_15480 [Pendulispora brunnea]|uniref:Uncharacterized protein n=1 Tax=Pendulispora brunnea TaxID=2905690 RepID=A0ABZ2KKU6_9BACT
MIWKATSERIEIRSFGFWQGSSGYDQTRAKLSPAQLTALEGLRVIPHPTGESVDATSYRVRVTDQDGSVVEYRAALDNKVDSDEGPGALPAIDIETLAPFLNTFQCMSATETRGDAVPTIHDDSGCLHGIFVPDACKDITLKWQSASAGDHRLELARCFDTTRIRVLSEDGTIELGAGATAVAPTCASLDVHLQQPGTYRVVLEKRNGAGCNAGGGAGDMMLRVR